MSIFSPLKWIKDIKNNTYTQIVAGDAFEIRYGVPSYSFTVDNTPPTGQAIINESRGKGGIKVHYFEAFGEATGNNTTATIRFVDGTSFRPWIAAEFKVLNDVTINSITLKFKQLGAVTNGPSGFIEAFVYDDLNFKPNIRIGESSNEGGLQLQLLKDGDLNFTFTFSSLSLTKNQSYWIVLHQTEEATVDANEIKTVEVYADESSSKIYAYSSVNEEQNPVNASWYSRTGKSFMYSLSGANPGEDSLGGINELQDGLGNYLRDASALGGSTSEFEFEVIGNTDALILQKTLDQTDEIPEVKTIVIGCTSAQPKDYVVEMLPYGSTVWTPLFKMQSNTTFRNYVKYTLTNRTQIDSLRVRYLGDYYARINSGTITVYGKDSLSGVKAIQLSHYTDFRDSVDVTGSDANGWVAFRGGVFTRKWDLVAEKWNWLMLPGVANGYDDPDPITMLIDAPRTFLAVGTQSAVAPYDTKIYHIDVVTNKLVEAASVSSFASGASLPSVNAFAIQRGEVYFGLSNGKVYKTIDGTTYDLVCTLPQVENTSPSISMLGSYLNYIYIGTSVAADNKGYVYSFDCNPNASSPLVYKNKFDAVSLSCFAAVSNRLYFGTKGGANQKNGNVEMYYNGAWSRAYPSRRDGIDFLAFSRTNKTLIAGTSSGQLVSLGFEDDLTPKTWGLQSSQPYTGFVNGIVNTVGDRLFFVGKKESGDRELASYLISSGQLTPLSLPPHYQYGIQKVRFLGSTNSADTNYYRNLVYYGIPADMGVQSEIAFDIGDATLTPGSRRYVMWKGWVRADHTETYEFELNNNGGAVLRLWNQDLIDNRVDTPTANTKTASIDMIAGQWVPFELGYYSQSETEDLSLLTLSLKWSSLSHEKSAISVDNFTPVDLDNIALAQPDGSATAINPAWVQNDGNFIVAAYSDGKLYKYDYGYLNETQRFAYVRFKDEADNISGVNEVVDDIYQDYEQDTSGSRTSKGTLFHIRNTDNLDEVVKNIYDTSNSAPALMGTRTIRNSASYDSIPYYVSNLTKWDKMVLQASTPTGTPLEDLGLEYGTALYVYIRNADNQDALSEAQWTLLTPTFNALNVETATYPTSKSITYYDEDTQQNVVVESLPGYDLSSYNKRWMQYRLVFVSASENMTPIAYRVRLGFKETSSSYFFTEMFNFEDYVDSGEAPLAVRGFMTANYLENEGRVEFGYTTTEDYLATFDFQNYIPINLNTTFTIPSGTNKIRIGAMLSSTTDEEAKIDDFGVMFDFGSTDIKMMEYWTPFKVGTCKLWLDATRIKDDVDYITVGGINYLKDISALSSSKEATATTSAGYTNVSVNRPGYDSIDISVDKGNFGVKILNETVSRQKITLPSDSSLNSSAITWTFVFTPDNYEEDKFYTLLSNTNGNNIIIAYKRSDEESSNILRVVSDSTTYDISLKGSGYDYTFVPDATCVVTLVLGADGALTVYKNGTEIGSTTGVALYASNPVLHLGTITDTMNSANPKVYYNFYGRIHELLVFASALTGDDLDNLTRYAVTKYDVV